MAKSFSFNPFTGNFDLLSTVSIGTANGLSITTDQVLSLALSSTSTTGALSSTDWNTFNGKQPAGNYITALTGDATASGPGSATLTLATVNSNVGSFGTASSTGSFTVNAKGLVTAASSTSIQITESQVTNLVSDLAGKQPTGNYITALTGDVTATGPGSVAATIATNAVTDTKFRQSAALSVVGNSTNATANVADITAASDGQVLRRSGTIVGFGAVSLSTAAAVTGTLPVGNGGTGGVTLAANGILYGNGTSPIGATAVGSSGQVLTSNGVGVAPTFQAAPGGVPSVTSKTTTYTATTADNTILVSASGGAFTVTLYTAVGNTGRTLTFVKTDSTVNRVTLDGNGSETIQGSLTQKLATQWESVVIQSDGANWFVLDHKTDTTTVTGFTYTFDGIGTFSNNTDNSVARVGDKLRVFGRVSSGTTSGTTFAITMPTGYLIDTTKLPAANSGIQVGHIYRVGSNGSAFASTAAGPFPLFYDGTTTDKLWATDATTATTFLKKAGNSIFGSAENIVYSFEIPITDWWV